MAGAILLPGWLMGFTGAGDVKLMAAVGAWLGHPEGFIAAVATLIAGGLIAVVVAARRGILKQALRNTLALGLTLLTRRGRESRVTAHDGRRALPLRAGGPGGRPLRAVEPGLSGR